jgi:peptide/nickel transport system ATP-binding protein
MEPLLQVDNLKVEFVSGDSPRHTAVDGMSFEIGAGEFVGLMGTSGCGKTSTALALLGLLPIDSARVTGSALFGGRQLFAMKENELQKIRGAEISLVFQEPEIALSPVMRVGEQVCEVIHAHGNFNWQSCRTEARSALARVGLVGERIFSAYPHQLSGGQRQRAVLAQALGCEPALLIADEPTASLDARIRADLLALLMTLKDEMDLAVLLISHSPEVQATLADRLLVMKEGKIVEQGSFEALYRNSSHPHTQSLLHKNASLGGSRTDESRGDGAERESVRVAW